MNQNPSYLSSLHPIRSGSKRVQRSRVVRSNFGPSQSSEMLVLTRSNRRVLADTQMRFDSRTERGSDTSLGSNWNFRLFVLNSVLARTGFACGFLCWIFDFFRKFSGSVFVWGEDESYESYSSSHVLFLIFLVCVLSLYIPIPRV